MLPLARTGNVHLSEWVLLTLTATFRRLHNGDGLALHDSNHDDDDDAASDAGRDSDSEHSFGSRRSHHQRHHRHVRKPAAAGHGHGDNDSSDDEDRPATTADNERPGGHHATAEQVAAALKERGIAPWPSDAYRKTLPVRRGLLAGVDSRVPRLGGLTRGRVFIRSPRGAQAVLGMRPDRSDVTLARLWCEAVQHGYWAFGTVDPPGTLELLPEVLSQATALLAADHNATVVAAATCLRACAPNRRHTWLDAARVPI